MRLGYGTRALGRDSRGACSQVHQTPASPNGSHSLPIKLCLLSPAPIAQVAISMYVIIIDPFSAIYGGSVRVRPACACAPHLLSRAHTYMHIP